jgi:hypothetical protein
MLDPETVALHLEPCSGLHLCIAEIYSKILLFIVFVSFFVLD